MKFKVKVGNEFDLEVNTEEEDPQSRAWTNWKSLAVIAVFLAVVASGTYAAVTHDFTLYDKLLQAVVSAAKAVAGEPSSDHHVAQPECRQ